MQIRNSVSVNCFFRSVKLYALVLHRIFLVSYLAAESNAKSVKRGSGSLASISKRIDFEEDFVPNARPIHSSLPHVGFSAKNEDWNSVQQSILSIFHKKPMPGKDMALVMSKVRLLVGTEIGNFIYDYYQNQLLKKGMWSLRDAFNKEIQAGGDFLHCLGEVWDYFYKDIVPLLRIVLNPIPVKDLTVRQVTLIAFRDNVVLKIPLADNLPGPDDRDKFLPPAIKQMLLVLQSVSESNPPTANFMLLESLVGQVINPYIGYAGVYYGSPEPAIKAKRQRPSMVVKNNSTKDDIGSHNTLPSKKGPWQSSLSSHRQSMPAALDIQAQPKMRRKSTCSFSPMSSAQPQTTNEEKSYMESLSTIGPRKVIHMRQSSTPAGGSLTPVLEGLATNWQKPQSYEEPVKASVKIRRRSAAYVTYL